MTKNKIKRLISILCIVGFSTLFIGYKIYNKPHINVANEAADIEQTANTLFTEFSIDETKANAKYVDKIIAVKGVVTSISEEGKKAAIALQTNDSFGTVVCYLTAKDSKKSRQIKEGQLIVLKGICTGFLMDVILVKCVVLNVK
jgi:hypothetical protein